MSIYIPWLIFAIVVVGLVIFCWFFIWYYMNKNEPSKITLTAGTAALMFALLAVFLLPVDVNVVGMDINSDGVQNDPSGLDTYQHDVRMSYYIMYSCLISFAFFWLPLAYFYYEAIDDHERTSTTERCSSAFKYALAFLVGFTVLLVIGLFINQHDPDEDWQKNITNEYNRAEDALSFIISIFLGVGMLGQVTYTAYGYAALPLNLMFSMWTIDEHRRAHQSGLLGDQDEAQREIQKLRAKYRSEDNVRNWNVQDRVALRNYERRLKKIENAQSEGVSQTCCGCLADFFWSLSTPVRFVIGLFFLAIHLLVVISITIHLFDQAINSKCSYECGWSLEKRNFTNPMNLFLQKLSDYFPLDYIFFALTLLILFAATLYGFVQIGVRFFCLKMFDLRPRETMHNGLIMAIWILLFVVFSLGLTIYELAPDYVTFGSQFYMEDGEKKLCSVDGTTPPNTCVPTVFFSFMTNIFVGYPVFGDYYFVMAWIFVVVYIFVSLFFIFGSRGQPEYRSLNRRRLEPHFY